MRKILILAVLLLFLILPLSADAGWTPSLSIGIGVNTTDKEYEGVSSGFLPVLALSAELDLISFRSGDEYVSFPIAYQYVLDNSSQNGEGARQDIFLSIRYGHRFGSMFRLYASGNIGYSISMDDWGKTWLFGGTITPAFAVNENFMVQLPISAHTGSGTVVIDARIMLTLAFDVSGEIRQK